MPSLGTKKYSLKEIAALNKLVTEFFKTWYPESTLNTYEANYEPLVRHVNEYHQKHKGWKEDIIQPGFVSDIYSGSSISKRKNIKKMNALIEFFNWAFNQGRKEITRESEKAKGEIIDSTKHISLSEGAFEAESDVNEYNPILTAANCGKHNFYYAYYYISADDELKFAIVGFNKDKKTNDWADGKIYYLTLNDDFSYISKEFLLQRIRHRGPQSEYYFFYKATFKERINLFTITTNGLAEAERSFMFLTYSAIEMQSRASSAGIGILEKINNLEEKINGLQRNGINPSIRNILFGKKILLTEKESMVVKPKEKLTNQQMHCLGRVKKFWRGYYLRHTIGEHTDKDALKSTGLIMFYLHIEDYGKMTLYYEEEDDNFEGTLPFKKYVGFVRFPFNESSFMKGELEYIDACKMCKLHLWLEYTGTSKDKRYFYSGIISGWVNKGRGIFSSAVFIEQIKLDDATKKMKPLEQLQYILSSEKPYRLKKEDLPSGNQLAHLKRKFKKDESKYLCTSDYCL